LFPSLPKLQKVTMPRYHLTSRVAECLSRLEYLGVVEFQYREEQGIGNPGDVASFFPSLDEGAFSSLWDLSLCSRFLDVTRLLAGSFAPSNITMLYIDSPISETPSSIHDLLSNISENCQLLKNLTLVPTVEISAFTEQPQPEDQLNFETLRPILMCPNLTSFEIIHKYPIILRLEDVEELASKWPSLETLVLNNEPASMHEPSLTLRALLPLARHCPLLRQLGLFLNATAVGLPLIGEELVPFKQLTQLSMGVSRVVETEPVALFLSRMCPLGCALNSGVTWDADYSEGRLGLEIGQRHRKWEEVGKLLPPLIQLRLEERERTRALQAEVEDLRIRTRFLMDKVGMVGDDSCIML
jgi:hypothetical protein